MVSPSQPWGSLGSQWGQVQSTELEACTGTLTGVGGGLASNQAPAEGADTEL